MRKKRFLSWFLTLCLLLGMFSFPAYAEGNTTTISGDGTADKTGTMTITLVIPKKTPAAADFTYSAPSDLIYSGSDKTATVVAASGVTGMGDITVKYYSDAARSTEVTETKNVGTYYVGATVAEGDEYAASTGVLYSDSWTFTVTASTPSAPDAPTVASVTKNSITLVATEGYEYSMDGTNWQDSPTFTGLDPDKSYTFYQRKKATNNYNPSESSTEGTGNTDADTYDMTITLVIKPAATVTKAPEAKTLTYNGQAQELVTAGEATGGTMQYALGTATEATEPYTASIPTGTNVGTYFVWYKAAGDAEHSDSAPQCVPAKISPDGKYLVYNGTAQPLVSAGEATGGTMQYALGTDDKTAPAEGWGEAIPTGTNAGTYYVWYKVTGDQNHNDSEAACVQATIAKKDLTVTADAKSKTQGEADPALTYTAEGLVGSDTLTGALSREAGEDPGTYAITQGTLTAGDNYEITFVPATLTINKAPAPDPGPAPAPAPAPSSGGGGGYYGGGTVQNQRRDAYSDVIGAAATSFRDSSPERIHNIELACEKLDGIVLQPGEVFSFNEAVGGLTAEAGFAVAPVNPDDEATAEMGGGVSQVASTLYTGSLFALLETVERTNHPFAVPFIQPGTDAYVANADNGSGPDLKFRNTRAEPIRISAKTRVDEARQVREIVIELQSALGSSDYMPIRFDNTWGGDQNAFLTATPYDLTRPGYRILLTHEEQQFTDASGAGIRTLTHRKILDAAGMLVRDEILNSILPDGSYAMDTYYQG